MASDSSRISITAHYTGYTWYKNNLSAPAFVTPLGKLSYNALAPMNLWSKKNTGIDLESMLLQRHSIIDERLRYYIEEQGVKQVVEFAAGLSPRGWRFMQRYGSQGLRYIEADLPAMSTRKRRLLEKNNMRQKGHNVMQCDILQRQGQLTMEHIIGGEFDLNEPVIFITEGLVNYFPLPTIEGVWRRMSMLLKQQGGGVYLSDVIMQNKTHPAAKWMKMGQSMVAGVAHGKVHMHFKDDAAAQQSFINYGFNSCDIHNPKNFNEIIPVDAQSDLPIVRVIEARV